MEYMLDSDARSLQDFCNKTGQSYSTFNQMLTKMRNELGQYREECQKALDTWEKVKEHFSNNRKNLTTKIQNLESELDFNPTTESVEEHNSKILQQIEMLKRRLIKEEEVTPTDTQDLDVFFDNIKIIN